jgi:S-adenosylmethionine-diacylglycerol 3-amino-3-carboxypropyl transferase
MVIQTTKKIVRETHDKFFQRIHTGRLIYNTSWEDPRIDRELMQLDGDSEVVMITSAGCNALDYLLDGPRAIHTIDVNYRQNALLMLKLKLIERGDYDDLFDMFGRGSHARHEGVYESIRHKLPDEADAFWRKKIKYFDPANGEKSFYYHGTSGQVAWMLRKLLLGVKKSIRPYVPRLLDADTLEEQREIYEQIEPLLWGRVLKWLMKQPALMAMLGVPRPQIRLIDEHSPGGLAGYVREKFRHVMTNVHIRDNYFWRVYVTGSYTPECCPNYLKEENFQTLADYTDRIHIHTCTVTDFLRENPGEYSHFVLLDHQDWLANHDPAALEEEWDHIFANSRPGAKVLMRSAGLDVSFLPESVLPRLKMHPELTEPLHAQDRVGTYGSLHFAEIIT